MVRGVLTISMKSGNRLGMCSSSGGSNCAPFFFRFLLVIAPGSADLLSIFADPGDSFLRSGFEGGFNPVVWGAGDKSLPEGFRRRYLDSTGGAEVGPLEVESCEKDLEVRKLGRIGRTGLGAPFAFATC